MPLPQRDRAGEYLAKGTAAVRRAVGCAQEQGQARRVAVLPPGGPPGRHILFLTPRDWALHVQFEGLLATALRQRGADVRMLGCGGRLEICDRSNTHEAPPMPCRTCARYVRGSADAFGIPLRELREGWGNPVDWPELDAMSIDELTQVEADDLALGALMAIPVRWFLLSARLDVDPLGAPTYRAFLRSARRMAAGFRAAIGDRRPDTVVMLNGLFSFEAVARAICEQEGIDHVTYERSHRAGAMVFRRGGAANRYELDGLWERRSRTPLTAEQDEALDGYLAGRAVKGHPLLDIWKDARRVAPERTSGGRLFVMFTNVTWDSSVLGRDRTFGSMHEWIDVTLDYFSARPQDELIVRAHPAEAKRSGKWTREPVDAYVRERYPVLPANVRLVTAEDPTSSYPLMSAADAGLVYTSTTGIEMAVAGKPVVVGGQAHYRGCGFTLDPEDCAEYVDALDAVAADPAVGVRSVELARRYAYMFFFEAPVALDLVAEPYPGLARLRIEEPDALLPGRNEALDAVCDSILGRATTQRQALYLST